MSIMDKINAQRETLQEREDSYGSFVRLENFVCVAGPKNRIRIAPPWAVDPEDHFFDQFWREVGQHWQVQGKKSAPIICPKMTEKLKDSKPACAVCDYCDALYKDKTNLTAKKLMKSIKAKRAFMLPIIDLNDPEYTAKDVANFEGDDCPFEAGDTKIKIYGAQSTVWTQLVAFMASNEVSIADLIDGKDILIDKQENTKDPMKTKYVASVLSMKESEWEAPENFKTPNVENAGWLKSYDEQLEYLAEGVGGDFPELLPGSSDPELPEDGSESEEEVDEDTAQDDAEVEASLKARMLAAQGNQG